MTALQGNLPQTNATVLIADDDYIVRHLLRHLLEKEGYIVKEVENGRQVLDVVQEMRPDVILLDAIMPDISGFEVCQSLQEMPGIADIPVLIITGLDDEENVDRAFDAGAVDYVTKPVNWPVLRQRVRRLLKTRELEALRDDLTQMIVHDMKNPIATIRGFAEMLLADFDDNPDVSDLLRRIYHNSNNLLEMTMMILDMGRIQEGKLTLKPHPRLVHEILEEVRDGFEWMSQNYQVQVQVADCAPTIEFSLDWSLIQRVLANLVSNAIKHSQAGGTVHLSCHCLPNSALRMSVTDQGEGIAEQDKSRIFEKFAQANERKKGSRIDTGLGLTFCKLATEAHGGLIELESTVGVGSTFTLIFPA
jgi:two-component system, sensor histidine kinase and response regulator